MKKLDNKQMKQVRGGVDCNATGGLRRALTNPARRNRSINATIQLKQNFSDARRDCRRMMG